MGSRQTEDNTFLKLQVQQIELLIELNSTDTLFAIFGSWKSHTWTIIIRKVLDLWDSLWEIYLKEF